MLLRGAFRAVKIRCETITRPLNIAAYSDRGHSLSGVHAACIIYARYMQYLGALIILMAQSLAESAVMRPLLTHITIVSRSSLDTATNPEDESATAQERVYFSRSNGS